MNLCLTDAEPAALNTHRPTFAVAAADLADLRDHSTSSPAIDMTTLRQLCLGNEAFALVMLDEFQADIPKQLVGLARLVADANALAIHEMAHSLKGIASTLAAEELRKATDELEAATSSDDWKLILKCVMQVHREALRCLAEISLHRPATTGPEFTDVLPQRG